MRPVNKYAFGENIRERLAELGKNQTWLADNADLTPNTLSFYMVSKKMPRAGTLYRIAKVLNCSMDDLMKGVYE